MKKSIYTITVSMVLLAGFMIPSALSAQRADASPILLAQAKKETTNPTGIQGVGTTPDASQSGAISGNGCKSASCIRDFLTLLQYFIYLIQNYLVSLLFAMALIFFFWNVAMFIWQPGDAINRDTNLQNIAWGIGALFVMFAIYGILAMIANTFNIGIGGTMEIPSFKVGK